MFKNLKIANMLLAVVVIFLSFQLLLGGLGYFSLNQVNGDVQALYRNSVHQGNRVNAASLSLVAARTDLSRYATRVAQGRLQDNASLLTAREHIVSADRNFAALEQTLTDAEKQAFAPYLQAYRKFSSNLQGVGRVLEAGDMEAYLKQGTQGVQDQYMKARDGFIAVSEAAGQATMQSIDSLYSLFITVLGAILLASIAVSIAVNVLARRLVVRPLLEVGELFKRIAAGDLTNRIVDHGRNEVGAVLATLKTMQGSLARIVTQVRHGVDEINVGAREISVGNTDLSSRTEEQAAALQQTAASMEQLAATVKQNADSAQQANKMVGVASTVAQRGGAVVASVVDTMGTISESSSRIAEIVSVIDSIAFQTNILALNAAVEAARAGEQGKGFAVVATEVRTLAQRSAGAAKEIKTLIEDSVQKVSVGSDQVANAGATMQEIVESVARVTGIMSEISAASDEQASGIDQVNTAVSQMDTVTQQNAALVEEAAAAAGSLEDQARELAHAVAVFKLPTHDVIDAPATAVGRAARTVLAGA